MVKLRDAYYCNLKLLLIWLVVFGHWIEPEIAGDGRLYEIYRLIYRFHMPLFVFVSGVFVKDAAGCIRQLRRTAPVYLGCQGTAFFLGKARWHTPWWVLWYLLSLCFWLVASALLLGLRRWGRWVALVLAVVLGCLVGRVQWIGREWSLSRTIVFFPYFWLGVLLPPEVPWHRFRAVSLGALLLMQSELPVTVLYHAGPCDPWVRLGCYGSALALGLLVLSWCPRGRFPWTRAGADTLPAYLLHGPLVRLVGPVRHPALAAAVYLYIISKATRWHRPYGIMGKEEYPWPGLKTCTRLRENRSIGSSWP